MKFELLKKLGVVSEELTSAPLTASDQATANSVETISIKIPTDELLYAIDLMLAKDTDGTLVDNLNEARLIIDGNKIVRKIRGGMLKSLAILNKNKPSTGFYPISLVDPHIDSDPLPLWGVTSAILELDVAAGGSGVKNRATLSLMKGTKQSKPSLGNVTLANVLFEKYLTRESFGATVGERKYTCERTQGVLGYLLELGDNGSLSDTAFTYVTLQLNSPTGQKQPCYMYPLKQLKENNTQQNNGNALPTGYFYLPFPDKLLSSKYTSIYLILYAAATPTDAQARVLERYVIGGQ